MKKISCSLIVLCMLVILGLAGCGGGATTSSNGVFGNSGDGGGDGGGGGDDGGGGGDNGGDDGSGGGGSGDGGTPEGVLSRTGQVKSYGTNDDGGLPKGVSWPNPRFVSGTDTEADCITDKLTGLMWAKSPDSTKRTWAVALSYANDSELCGHRDWRLPNRRELRSLINYGEPNTTEWLNSSQGFSNIQADYYWSSTTYATFPGWAWNVSMADGSMGAPPKDEEWSTQYVWPVRSGQGGKIQLSQTGQTTCYNSLGDDIACTETGQDGEIQAGMVWPDTRFSVSGECVTDNLTGLMWAKSPDSTIRTWAKALAYANGLPELCGLGGWRLPNINELESLIHAGQSAPETWLMGQGFTGVEATYYWTSTTHADNAGFAWYINLWDGSMEAVGKSDVLDYPGIAWPVRSVQ